MARKTKPTVCYQCGWARKRMVKAQVKLTSETPDSSITYGLKWLCFYCLLEFIQVIGINDFFDREKLLEKLPDELQPAHQDFLDR